MCLPKSKICDSEMDVVDIGCNENNREYVFYYVSLNISLSQVFI